MALSLELKRLLGEALEEAVEEELQGDVKEVPEEDGCLSPPLKCK